MERCTLTGRNRLCVEAFTKNDALDVNAVDFDKLPDSEKEHFHQCSKCGEFVDKRELRDVIFHESDHNRQALALPRIIGKPIPKRPSRH